MLGRFSIRSTDEQVQALHLRLHPQYLLHKYCNIYQQFDRTPPVINQHTHKYTRVGERKRKAALITLCKKPSAASDQYALVLQTVSNVVEGSHRSPIWNGKGQMRSLTQLRWILLFYELGLGQFLPLSRTQIRGAEEKAENCGLMLWWVYGEHHQLL